MIFSKTFGYALRGILYVAMYNKDNRKVQLEEISSELNVPRYFMGKIMNKMVRQGVLESVKGHNGGFNIREHTLNISLLKLCELTGEPVNTNSCILDFKTCRSDNPCPLHERVLEIKQNWNRILSSTLIKDLMETANSELLRSISLPGS